MTTSIWCYLWDLVDEGIDRALDEIQEAGLDGISIATAYHSVEHWRIHNVRPFIFRERDASLYFEPQRVFHRKSGLKPKISPLALKGNPLKRIAAKCEQRGLDLNSWTVGTHNSYLCRQYPDCAEGNIFGDDSATALCPANPQVRDYLVALMEDLSANYPFRTIELESFTFEAYRHFHSHEKIGIPFSETDRFLLGLCFCRCCQGIARKSGVDVEKVGRFVGNTLFKVFDSGKPTRTPLDEFVAHATILHPYLAAREWTIESLMADLRQASKSRLVFMHFADRRVGGYDLAKIARYFDGVMLLCYATPRDTRNAIQATRKQLDRGARLVTGFHAYAPVTPNAETLREQVQAARGLGVTDFNFYNCGIMPRKNLRWVKAALAG